MKTKDKWRAEWQTPMPVHEEGGGRVATWPYYRNEKHRAFWPCSFNVIFDLDLKLRQRTASVSRRLFQGPRISYG